MVDMKQGVLYSVKDVLVEIPFRFQREQRAHIVEQVLCTASVGYHRSMGSTARSVNGSSSGYT